MTRAIVADDSLLMREGIARLLADAGIEIVGLAADAAELLTQVGRTRADLVVVDIRMPPTYRLEGLEAAVQLRRQYPGTSVLVLSQYLEAANAFDLLRDTSAGVGYLLKQRVTAVEAFIDAVRRVAAGGTAVDEELVALLLGRPRTPGPLESLTERETEVLVGMAQGRTNAGLARQLHLSLKTVETHVHSIFRKLDLPRSTDDHRRVLAVLAYLRRAPEPPQQPLGVPLSPPPPSG